MTDNKICRRLVSPASVGDSFFLGALRTVSSWDKGGSAVAPLCWRLALKSWKFRVVLVIINVSIDMLGTMLLIFLGEMSIKASK